MRKRKLGKDLVVSAVGLGCMGMSHAYGAPADKNEMRNLLAKAVDIAIPVSIQRKFMEQQSSHTTMKNWSEKH